MVAADDRNMCSGPLPGQSGSGEILTYESDSMVYAMNWSTRRGRQFRLGVGSFREERANVVEIIELDEERNKLVSSPALTIQHDFPPTKLMFIPNLESSHPDLMATAGEVLRVWHVHDDADPHPGSGGKGVRLQRVLHNVDKSETCEHSLVMPEGLKNGDVIEAKSKSSEFSGPLTSFDWSEQEARRIATCSLDTTVTIWDIEAKSKSSEFSGPLTSFDWSEQEARRIATCSLDTTVTIWDIE
ncbi:WD_REPEATS_REGION domain-containing protein, partial [Haematococcus lacustris]